MYFNASKYKDALIISREILKLKNIPKQQQLKLSKINANSQIRSNQISGVKNIPTKNQTQAYNEIILESKYNFAIASKNYADALKYSEQLIAKAHSKKETSARLLAKHYVKKAEIHYKLEQYDTALFVLKNAIKILLPNTDFKTTSRKR